MAFEKNLLKYTVGIDLGGTKLAAGLVDGNGKILAFQKESVLDIKNHPRPQYGQQKLIDLMIVMILNFKKEYPDCFSSARFKGIGLASAGPLNTQEGRLILPSNFPLWKQMNIVKMLQNDLQKADISKNLFFQNDAVCAAFAEGWVGKAKDLKSYAVVTIGTGIGTGVIFNGQPVQTHGMGSEFGHMIIRENRILSAKDLHPQTVEGISSGTGLLRRAKEELSFRGNSIEDLVLLLAESPHKYQYLFDDAADSLAALCYNLSVGFNLEKILLSGGLIKIKDLYFDRLKKRYSALIREMNPHFQAPIQIAKTKNKAGVIGAASLPHSRRPNFHG